MSNSNTTNDHFSIAQSGGKTAAKNLTAEQRSARAKHASLARKCFKDLPKATHSGVLQIGSLNISCAVLEDGKRVISESSMFEILGRTRGGRKKGADLPRFLDASNLKHLILKNMSDGPNIVTFVSKQGKKSKGYEATIIPDICKIFIDARNCGILTETQMPTAEKCEMIVMALAKVGITSLVDEAVGFQEDREKTELQKLFNKFLSKELQPWTKRFPDDFFENIKRLYGLQHLKGNPQFCGKIINNYIYDQISPEILVELQQRNPITENGFRKHKHHQLLTDDIGHPALSKQIVKVNTVMSVSETKEEFDKLWQKLK